MWWRCSRGLGNRGWRKAAQCPAGRGRIPSKHELRGGTDDLQTATAQAVGARAPRGDSTPAATATAHASLGLPRRFGGRTYSAMVQCLWPLHCWQADTPLSCSPIDSARRSCERRMPNCVRPAGRAASWPPGHVPRARCIYRLPPAGRCLELAWQILASAPRSLHFAHRPDAGSTRGTGV